MRSEQLSKTTFVPRWWLRSGHLQTIAGKLLPRRSALPAPECRLLHVEHNIQVLCHCHWQPQRQQALTLLVVHGLEGSSASPYVVGTADKAWRAGMNVVRMNVRNCGGTEHLGPTLYHSGMSADIGEVVQALIRDDGLTRVALAGFSMGGNQVLKLAGEWGAGAPPELRAVAAVSPAADLAPSAAALHFPRNRIYELYFLVDLKRRLRYKASLFPELYDAGRLRGVWTLRAFDNRITAPYCGFRDADDYYDRASASHVVDRIAVPTLIIHAVDDPFIRMLPDTRARLLANPHVRLVETRHGGHCAFISAADGYDGRWAEREVVEFVSAAETRSLQGSSCAGGRRNAGPSEWDRRRDNF